MSSTPGSSRALQIPPRSPTSDSDSAGFVTDRASFVGSPDALPPNENAASRSTMYLPPSPLSLHPPPSSRPGMGQRSVSTPGTPSTLRSSRRIPVVQSARRVASRMLRLSEGGEGVDPPLSSSHPREREWTLFGQRMENEGQLRASGVDFGAATYRLSRNLRSPNMEESNTYDSRLTASSESGLSVEQNVYTTGSAVQSPAADPSMPDPFDAATNPGHGQTVSSYDFTYDSDDTSSTHSVEQQPSPVVSTPKKTSWGIPTLTPLHRNILKCGIAYFIGSLFTFNPYLSGLISDITSASGPSPSGHMVATVAVYFNPAKTAGGMVEADIYCLMGLLFAAFVSLCSMESFWWFEVQPGWEWLADVLVIFGVGISVSIIAWMKLWMAKPTFNPACSMAAIILFTVVVKEGGAETLAQTALVVLFGALVSNIVCYLIWPTSATTTLRSNMQKTLDSFSTLLSMLTGTFLLEEDAAARRSEDVIQKAIASHQASFTSLKKSLDEARSEAIFGGPSSPSYKGGRKSLGQAYEDAVDSLNRLGQHLNGLRGGTRLQFELTKAHVAGKLNLKNRGMEKGAMANSKAKGSNERDAMLIRGGAGSDPLEEDVILQAAADMFRELVDDLGPPLKALSTSCGDSLQQLRAALTNKKGKSPDPEYFRDLVKDIERALFTFESTSNHAVLRLYRKSGPTGDYMDLSTSNGSIGSVEEAHSALSNSEYENLFLVYFFIFTLQEFARELESLVDALGRVCAIEEAARKRGSWWKRNIIAGFHRLRGRFYGISDEAERHRRSGKRPMRRPISAYILPNRPFAPASWFPKVRPHAPNTMQTPPRAELSRWGRFKQSIWALGARAKEHDVKYAFKAGMSTALLAAPAFFDKTRPIFMAFRGEWALISLFVVISPTIGATNNLSIHRIAGTLLGAFTAAGIYSLFPDNAIVLSIFGFLFSLPCFFYIVARPQYATSGRFVLLAYNLTCLYCYNLRKADVEVIDIAFKRSVSVTVGVVYAFVISRIWWPSEARRELSFALGEFCSNIGWLYMRLVAHNSFAAHSADFGTTEDQQDDGASTPRESHDHQEGSPNHMQLNSIQEFMAMELHLQIKLIELQGLLAQTVHEPRLKGPFPVMLYRSILTSLQTILDRLHSMRCVTTREEWYTEVRREFILPVNKERREMVGNIVLYFSILSSAFRLKAPLPPYLPPAESARQRLVDCIRELDIVKRRDVRGSKQLLFFAYAMTMKSVTQELELLGKTLQEAFGVIGQSAEEFDGLFGLSGRLV